MPKLPVDSEADRKGSMDVLCNSDEFRMYCFKVLPCSKHYSHDWTICPFAHPGEKARRRDPRVFKYAGVECPHVKEGLKCPRGDLCPFAHNIFECWLHPTRYRTQLCNEPASCKRKVCFFAHALEELREPCNPTDTLPEGGIGSGNAPRMSLDGLTSTNTLNGLLNATHPQRQSFDVASLGQFRSHSLDPNIINATTATTTSSPNNNSNSVLKAAASNQLNVNNLLSGIQALNVQDQVQQNQQLTQLVVGLLGEIAKNDNTQQQQQQISSIAAAVAANNNQHQHQRQQQQQQQELLQSTLGYGNGVASATMAPTSLNPSLPRWSVDGHFLSSPSCLGTNQFPMHSAYQYPPTMMTGNPVLPVLSQDNSLVLNCGNRRPSLDQLSRDTAPLNVSQAAVAAVVGRASIDNSALTAQGPISPHRFHPTTGSLSTRFSAKQNFQSILEDPVRSSDERSSSGTSSGDYSSDCQKTENYPVSYPLDGDVLTADNTIDSNLPEPFILF